MNNRNPNPELLAKWMQAWTTLGRWQALNARLAREAIPPASGWVRRSSPSSSRNAVADASVVTPGW